MKLKKQFFFKILFLLIYISKYLTDSLFVSRRISSPILYAKYAFALIFIALGILEIVRFRGNDSKKAENQLYTKPLLASIIVSIVFIIITIGKMVYLGEIYFDVFAMSIKILLPAFIVLIAANYFNEEDIYSIMKTLLLFGFVSYILQIGIHTFNISNLKKISFSNSVSPFESHYFNSVAIMSCCYFNYYRKNKWLGLFSTLFVFSTFKRISIIFAVFLFVAPFFINLNKPIKKTTKYLFATFFVGFTVIYYYLIQPQNWDLISRIVGQDIDRFTMGRSVSIYNLSSGFLNYGIGSTERFLGKSIEMDLVQILIEVSIVGLCVFCYSYWKIIPNNLYAALYMSFLFLNMIMSHSLSDGFSWGTNFLIIFSMTYFPSSIDETDRTLIHFLARKHKKKG